MKYSNIDYELVEYEQGDGPDFSKEAWFSEKHNLGFDFPNLPYLIDGDFKLTETQAIHKYLAAKCQPELLGEDVEHKAYIDMLANVIYDLKWAITRPLYDGNRPAAIKVINEKFP